MDKEILVKFDNYKPHTLNYTDIRVWHDPELQPKKIGLLNNGQGNGMTPDENGKVERYSPEDNKKVDGIWYPIIQVNNVVVDRDMILRIELDYNSFVPSLILDIFDRDNLIKKFDTPGMNNFITVIIVPPSEKGYKKISLTFYISNVETYGDNITYYASLKIPAFMDTNIGSISFNDDKEVKYRQNGCKECKQNSNPYCNFWELLHVIASNAKLGFASTNKCKEIQDRLPRNIRTQSWEDYINEQLEFAGLDEDSIFDAWVDLYGYLTLVNVSYIMSEDVKTNELGIHPEIGSNFKDKHIDDVSLDEMVPRILHNFNNMPKMDNLSFNEYEVLNSNGSIIGEGAFRSYYIFGLEANGQKNTLSEYQNLIIENSRNGSYIDSYKYSNGNPKILTSFNDEYYSTTRQKILRNSYFDKLRAHMIKIKMTRINFGLQRGTLVMVMFWDDSSEGKRTILEQSSNLVQNKDGNPYDVDTTTPGLESLGIDKYDFMQDSKYSAPNLALSGMYYIDAMKFHYNHNKDGITQELYLIRKTQNITNYYDGLAQINVNELNKIK